MIKLALYPYATKLLRCVGGSCLALADKPQPTQWSVVYNTTLTPPDYSVTSLAPADGVRLAINPPPGAWQKVSLACYVSIQGADQIRATATVSSGANVGAGMRLLTYAPTHNASTAIQYWDDEIGVGRPWGDAVVLSMPFWSCVIEAHAIGYGGVNDWIYFDLYRG